MCLGGPNLVRTAVHWGWLCVFRWSKFGQDLLYTGGGYVQELGTSFNQTLDILQQLADAHWLDRR